MIEYDFSTHEEIMNTISQYSEEYSTLTKNEKQERADAIKSAVVAFLKTRTNSELLDIPNICTINGGKISDYWDTDELYMDLVLREWYSRDIMITKELTEVINEVHPDAARYKDNSLMNKVNEMKKQVNGIQRKIDRIVKLLDNFEVKMKLSEALDL